MNELRARARWQPLLGVLCGLVITCVIGTGLWLMFSPTRDQLLEQGLRESRRDPVAAERTLRRVVRLSGGRDHQAKIALCRLMVRRNALTDAKAMFAKLDLSTCRPDLLLALGRDGLKTGFRTESLAALEETARRDSRESALACDLLLADYGEWGQRQKQLDAATRLTELQPENPRSWGARVEILTTMGLEIESVEAIRAARRHGLPAEALQSLQYTLVQQLVNLGDATTARKELAELISQEGASARARGLEVYLCRLEGDLDRALEIVTTIVDEAPDLPFPRFTRGVVLLDLRRFDEAARDLERVAAAQPLDAPARFKLSEAYRGLGRDKLATKYRQQASDIVNKQKQISALLKSREENPVDPATYQTLAAVHEELGDAQAAAVWRKWADRVAHGH
ncbi:MAG: tetratricopeptide repeat protein [Planctomycetes bacterium]|nr:tetratricopeptide repeat protein [Planctomycetota bacterium]